jgi:pre-rRNA-processing protein TSR4
MELEREEISIDGMEWGTIIVGVCERDCQQKGVQNGEIGYVEEWAGVQWEELNERR